MILDIWSTTPKHVDIRIPRTSVKGFLSLLPEHINEHEPIITNLRAAVDYTYPVNPLSLPSIEQLFSMTTTDGARENSADIHALNDIFFSDYQSYSTVNEWMYLLESLRPELVSVVNIGSSYEGREILGLVIRGGTHASPGIVMHGAQHAREWISVSTVCYIAYQLVAGYYSDPTVRKLVDEFEWR